MIVRVLLGLLLAFAASGAWAQTREEIRRYDVRIEVHPSGDIVVTEAIEAVALGREIRRGIYRDLPLGGVGVLRLGRAAFTLVEASRDGQEEAHRIEETGEGIRLYLGRADVTLDPGPHRYRIVYRVGAQVDPHDGFDEIYWNATGNGWAFPIRNTRVTVVPPPGAAATRTAVYTGAFGAEGAAATADIDGQGNPVFVATGPLMPGEGMTVAVGWPTGFIDAPSRGETWIRWLERHGATFVGLAMLALLFAYYLLAWWRVGRDPPDGTIIPVYRPQLPPAAMRFIERMGADATVLTAAILSLAVKGRLVISASEDGTQRLTKAPEARREPASPGEEAVLAELFAAGPELEVGQAARSRLVGASSSLRRQLERSFDRTFFRRNRGYFLVGAVLTLLGWIAVALLSADGLEALIPLFFVAVWATVMGSTLVSALGRLQHRFRESGSLLSRLVALVGALVPLGIGLVWAVGALGTDIDPWPFALLVAAALINLLFFHLLKAPTTIGRDALDEIEGTRLYLSVAEAERLRFHNPPDKTPEHFHAMLPYAVALGVETDWTDQFQAEMERAQSSGDESYTRPGWYVGRRLDVRDFGRLGGNLSRAVASATRPRSSGRSGGGSGGGGFSGGGRGGGGGGGW